MAYLGLVVILSGLGMTVLWLRNRKPSSLDHGISEFQRELRALAPDLRDVRSSPPAYRADQNTNPNNTNPTDRP